MLWLRLQFFFIYKLVLDPYPDSAVCVCVCAAMFLSDRTFNVHNQKTLSPLMTLLPVLVNNVICIVVHTQDKIVCDWCIADSDCVRIMEIQKLSNQCGHDRGPIKPNQLSISRVIVMVMIRFNNTYCKILTTRLYNRTSSHV